MRNRISAVFIGCIVALSAISCSDPVSPRPDGEVYTLESVNGLLVAGEASPCGTVTEARLYFQTRGEDGAGTVRVTFINESMSHSETLLYTLVGRFVLFAMDRTDLFGADMDDVRLKGYLSADGSRLEAVTSVCYIGYSIRDPRAELVYRRDK